MLELRVTRPSGETDTVAHSVGGALHAPTRRGIGHNPRKGLRSERYESEELYGCQGLMGLTHISREQNVTVQCSRESWLLEGVDLGCDVSMTEL